MARRAIAVLAAATALVALAAPAAAQETSLPDIEDEVMCPICGVTLELATEAPQANQERDLIRELIAQGQTKEEIKDRLVAEFGPEVLAVPEAEGFDLAAWLVPGLAIVLAGGAIFIALRRWRRSGTPPDGGDNGGGPPASEALDPEDAVRLETDLAKYEL